jgi:hypothetical protein
MQFHIADTLTGSLTKLNNHEQKTVNPVRGWVLLNGVKTTVFDLQVNPVCFLKGYVSPFSKTEK